ncbi:hypothetical protein SU69_09345 [Thermosipho melanesiensis]|nr:hypothetical protein [Thermosipho melanesiensis]APT74957.1 hypothetical protein BW47_09725 [Thermosipho melanesiensis]OOC35210.1 hypothetical protein SU69_09345 [Thermosipho melanesiensis]OOC35420.1 hypothetical protein SU70_09355 [Thermosipho melanesiensis]OOC36671.1 hypothetical protein SU68_09415 [Thermosipho melanesiensis]OOC39992.1 hypothetical protein SU71_09340 [Thermosipho melanesiensis]
MFFLISRFSDLSGVYMFLPVSNKMSKVFPLEIRYIDGKFVAINSQCEIDNFSEIISIDNFKIEELFKKISGFGIGKEKYQFFSKYFFPYLGDILRKKRLWFNIKIMVR